MSRLTRTAFYVTVVVTSVALMGTVMTARTAAVQTEEEEQEEEERADTPPPKGQTYTGVKRCASCHFQQFMVWKKTGHAKSFDLLTAKYEKDPKCLKCHTTGYGKPTGYKDESDTALQGTTCEACHGPGSKHEEVCQAFKNKKLNEEEEKVARDSIWLMTPKNICVECHAVQAHKKSETPEELRKK